jgi:hypothetical protein
VLTLALALAVAQIAYGAASVKWAIETDYRAVWWDVIVVAGGILVIAGLALMRHMPREGGAVAMLGATMAFPIWYFSSLFFSWILMASVMGLTVAYHNDDGRYRSQVLTWVLSAMLLAICVHATLWFGFELAPLIPVSAIALAAASWSRGIQPEGKVA